MKKMQGCWQELTRQEYLAVLKDSPVKDEAQTPSGRGAVKLDHGAAFHCKQGFVLVAIPAFSDKQNLSRGD